MSDMKNCLVTINTNDFLCQNVRDSYLHAANRWGCEYVEVTGPTAGERDHWLDIKLNLYKRPDLQRSRVFYLDADAVIRSDCPNPFNIVPARMFSCVLNCQDDPHGITSTSERNAWDSHARHLDRHIPYDGLYLNGGMLMFEPDEHGYVFEEATRIYRLNLKGGEEQTALSIALRKTNAPVWILDRRWNRVGPFVWGNVPNLPAWITHYAKWYVYRGENRNEILASAKWLVGDAAAQAGIDGHVVLTMDEELV